MENKKSIRSKDHPPRLLTFVYLVLLTLFVIGVQNEAFAEHKLIDELRIEPAQEQRFTLHFDQHRQQLHVTGIMEIGILPAFREMLAKHPDSIAVAFNSNGGNIYQARGLARLIMLNGLDTYVDEDCYSACTIAYVAGKSRYMSPNGRLGFHQYSMNSRMLNHRIDIKKEQARDLSFFKSRIPGGMFIDQIFSSESAELWVPKQKDLLASGVIHAIVVDSER